MAAQTPSFHAVVAPTGEVSQGMQHLRTSPPSGKNAQAHIPRDCQHQARRPGHGRYGRSVAQPARNSTGGHLDHKGQSGREDLNLRPPAPKAGALARLRYAPNGHYLSKLQAAVILLRFGSRSRTTSPRRRPDGRAPAFNPPARLESPHILTIFGSKRATISTRSCCSAHHVLDVLVNARHFVGPGRKDMHAARSPDSFAPPAR